MTIIIVRMKPVTQGSMTAMPVRRKNGKYSAVMYHTNSNEIYEQRAGIQTEYEKVHGQYYEKEPIDLKITFSFIRPKSVSAKSRPYHIVKPDLDKLTRAVLDGLTNVAYKDDSQVMRITASKIYSEDEYIWIEVNEYGKA